MTLSVENACFSYGKHRVLNNISFTAGPGDLVAILGPNGAGKTTLLRCIMGMLKWDSGKSCIDGENIRAMPARALWQKVAYVPQARSAESSVTALQSVLLGRSSYLRAYESPGRAEIRRAMGVLEGLGIARLADQRCSEMSGGELQMVLIARALVAEPQILILDEPESNLDFKNQLIVLNTMSSLAEKGMTCVFNTHYPAHALQRANKALILHKDGDFHFGNTTDVVTEENIRLAFGVKAAIGEIETDSAQIPGVVPLEIAAGTEPAPVPSKDLQSIAALTIMLEDNEDAKQVNVLLHGYEEYIIGRMGMPYKRCDLFIIHVTLDAPESVIRRLYHQVSLLRGVSAKLTFAKQKEAQE